ncbi:hypothetical protein MPL3356_350032 [Mesorhizobium plurifarium]|uniref:Uncharacterized protein n=1 Tax=Mesorhizobium plurifarium TaxID=69974 RepID=A0A090DW83_MESPL|nr:hypothetical protein MPL3356_350032 [Mesorhizobium plurifarium]
MQFAGAALASFKSNLTLDNCGWFSFDTLDGRLRAAIHVELAENLRETRRHGALAHVRS